MGFHIDVTFTPDELARLALEDKTVVVIDVLRATTTIVTALEHGALGVLPVTEVEDARRLAAGWPDAAPALPQSGGSEAPASSRAPASAEPLLAGERGAKPPAGFHLGNSPLAFTPEVAGDRPVILTTTNGTRTLTTASQAAEVRVAALRNAAAVAAEVADGGRDTVIACAGTEGRMSLEDVACAGRLLTHIQKLRPDVRLGDGARLVDGWFRDMGGPAMSRDDWEAFLGGTVHGRRLLSLGFDADVAFCANVDASSTVPVLRNGWLVDPT